MDWKRRFTDHTKKTLYNRERAQNPDDGAKNADEVKALADDVKDVGKIAAHAAAGNFVGAVSTTLKNKKTRRILVILLVATSIIPMIGFMLMMTLIIGSADLFQHPMMDFGSNQTITETEANGQTMTIHFNQLANEWEKSMKLTSEEIAQVNQLQLGLSYGLLETFYEIGARQGTKSPLKTLYVLTKQLEPSAIHFKPVRLRKVTLEKVKSKVTGKIEIRKVISYITEEVLQNMTRYNGYWTVQWHTATKPNGSQRLVLDGATLAIKNYTPLYKAEKAYNILRNTLDQQELFGQALVLDSNFYDPSALPILKMFEGGNGNGLKGVSVPKSQIVAILQQAIQIDHVPESWLPGLEIIVGHEDASGNPYAVDPILVDGEHAIGLMQMLPSTFWANHVPGYENIWNPLDNTVAAIRHIERAWGNPYNIPGVVSGEYTGY